MWECAVCKINLDSIWEGHYFGECPDCYAAFCRVCGRLNRCLYCDDNTKLNVVNMSFNKRRPPGQVAFVKALKEPQCRVCLGTVYLVYADWLEEMMPEEMGVWHPQYMYCRDLGTSMVKDGPEGIGGDCPKCGGKM